MKFYNKDNRKGLPEFTKKNKDYVKVIFTDHVYNTEDKETIDYLELCTKQGLYGCITEERFYELTNPSKLFMEHKGVSLPISYVRQAIDFAHSKGFAKFDGTIRTEKYTKGIQMASAE
jgi:hypothetical protein